MTKQLLSVFSVCLLAASSASAAIISTEYGTATIVNNDELLAGFVVNDVYINAPAGDSIGAIQILLEPDAGSTGTINQFTIVPSDVRPSAGIIGAFPAAAFDTYVAAGTLVDGATPLIFGASDSLGGPGGPAVVNSTSRMDVTFSPAAGQNTLGAQNFLAARIVLSTEYQASNSFNFLADFVSASGETILNLPVVNGGIGGGDVIPEPTTFGLAGLALAAVGFRRRR